MCIESLFGEFLKILKTISLSVLNRCNSTPEPDGAYWGILARIVATWPNGQTASIDAVFHDDSE